MTPWSEALIIQSDMYNLVKFYVPDDQLSATQRKQQPKPSLGGDTGEAPVHRKHDANKWICLRRPPQK